MTILLLLLYVGGGLAPFCLCDKDLLDYTVNNIRKFSLSSIPQLLFFALCDENVVQFSRVEGKHDSIRCCRYKDAEAI